MDWDDAYANRKYIAQADTFPLRWAAEAAELRADLSVTGRARLDLAYGEAPRERFDLFLPEAAPEGLLVFVHGGYWHLFGKDDWSHLAKGALARGWAVAMPGYTLCPQIRIAGITRQIAMAISAAAAEVSGPIRLVGHSAGGHLVSRMLCQDVDLDAEVVRRLTGALSLSGVHDLRPLLRTTMNGDLHLDAAEAAAESPVLAEPRPDIPLVCWVGADERPEFVRQNALLANIWAGFGPAPLCVEEPGPHHFNVIDGLTQSDSPLMNAVLGA